MEVKNYNQPVDASLFPEGCPRCSLLKFLLHLVPVAAVGLWGAYAAFRVLAHGLGETGLDDYFGFGLWITFDLAVIALGAGAFFTGALRYLLNIDALKNIINLTVVVGFLCYSGAMLVLVLDIGQPLRAWFGYWHPNVVAEGKISEENAKKLNHIICTLFLGYFKFVQEHGVSQEEIPELVNQFIQESKEITQCYAYDFTPK